MMSLIAFSQKRVPKGSSYTASYPYATDQTFTREYLLQENQILAIKFQAKKMVIQKFDATKPAFTSEKEYEYKTAFLNFSIFNFYSEGLHEINDHFYFFYSLWDKPNKKEQLFAYEIDFQKVEFVGQPQLLLQVDGKVTHSNFHKFETQISSDKKTIVVKYKRDPLVNDDKKNFDVMGIASFDSNLKKIAVKEIKMPYTERRIKNLDYQIDGKGNLFLLSKVFHDDSQEDKKSKSDTEANYHIEIFTVKLGSDKIIIAKLEDKDKFVNSLQLFDDQKSSGIIAGGYYSNGKGKNFQDNSDGVLTFKVKEDGSIADKNYYDIPVEIINQYESTKTKNRNERKEENGEGAKFTFLKLKNLKLLEDGSIVLIGEQFIENTQNSLNGGGQITTIKYNDILVAKINSDGKLGWMRKVPKQQFGFAANDGTFKFLSTSDNLFLLYLDNIKNIDLTPDQEPVRHINGEGGYLTSVKMDLADGSFTKTSILNTRDVENFKLQRFSPFNTVDLNDNSFVIEAPRSKTEEVMVKITLK